MLGIAIIVVHIGHQTNLYRISGHADAKVVNHLIESKIVVVKAELFHHKNTAESNICNLTNNRRAFNVYLIYFTCDILLVIGQE